MKKLTSLMLVSFILILATVFVNAEEFEWVTQERIGKPDAEISITWVLQKAYSPFSDVTNRVDFLKGRMEQWCRKHPYVKIIPELAPGDVDLYHSRLMEQARAGRAPDIAQIDGQMVNIFSEYLQTLNKYFTQQEIDDFYDFAKDGAMINPKTGELKSVWFVTNGGGLWYRKDIINNPPETWEGVIVLGKKLQNEGFEYGFEYSAKGESTMFLTVLPMFYSQGGKLFDENGLPIFNEGKNREALINVFDFLRETIEEGITPVKVVDMGLVEDQLADPLAGETPMFIGGSYKIGQMRNTLGEEKFNQQWGFAHIPQMNSNLKGTVTGGWNWGIFAEDESKKALAIDFLNYVYVGPEGMAGWTSTAGYSPTRKSVTSEFTALEDPWQQSFSDKIQYGYARPGVRAYSLVSNILQDATQAVILMNSSPEEAIDKAWEKTKRELGL